MQQQQVAQPKLNDAQIQAQLDNMKWQEQQSVVANAWQRDYNTKQQHIEHVHYMTEHLAYPMAFVVLIFLAAYVILRITFRGFEVGTERNRDDNQADVLYARRERVRGNDDNVSQASE